MKKSLFNRCRAVIDANYSPANRMFTSNEEIEYVSELMGLDELDKWDLQNLRDMWVMMHQEIDPMLSNGVANYQRFSSVVAIIDNKMYGI